VVPDKNCISFCRYRDMRDYHSHWDPWVGADFYLQLQSLLHSFCFTPCSLWWLSWKKSWWITRKRPEQEQEIRSRKRESKIPFRVSWILDCTSSCDYWSSFSRFTCILHSNLGCHPSPLLLKTLRLLCDFFQDIRWWFTSASLPQDSCKDQDL